MDSLDGEKRGNGSVRTAALDFMRDKSLQDRGAGAGQERARPNGAHPLRNPSFANLPQYRQVLAHEAAGLQLGIENPFFRSHEGAAGATTVIGGATAVNFSSYDYLGMNAHPTVRERAAEAIVRYGISASASRLVAGERPVHDELESVVAEVYGVEAAVAFVSGYLTNVTTIGCLLDQNDLIIHDELIHNSALAGARMSGATRRSFRHNDMNELARLLSQFSHRHRRVLVVVEGLYSMDGDIADLPALIKLRKEYGFWLMVDEAHALGVLGERGRGTFEHFGIDPAEVDIWMGTLSKTTASCGGYVAGSKALITVLKGYAGGFVYSVGMAPTLAAAARASLEIMMAEPERTARLKRNGQRLLECAAQAGLATGESAGFSVVPVMVGDSVRAVRLSNELLAAGFNVLPIIYPAVQEGMARLRFFVTSEHTDEQIEAAVTATAETLARLEKEQIGIASVAPEGVLEHMRANSA